MQRLSSQDASFLQLEDAVSHLHIGAVGLFEGPPPSPAEFEALVAAKLALVPQYRQRVEFVPLALARPVWAPDSGFALDNHLFRTSLAAPGGERELQALIGRLMSHPLDRRRPLWELWLIEGVSGGRWGLLTKVHHALADGVSGAALIRAMLDETPEPGPEAAAGAQAAHNGNGRPGPEPRAPGAGLVAAAREAPQTVGQRVGELVQGLTAYSSLLRPPAPCSLNGPIGPARRWAIARGELAEVKRIRSALGGTVNDVVLAAITGGFRELLAARGEGTQRVVRTLVPVSVRGEGEHGIYNNRVSAMFADLPVGIADPADRLRALSAHLAQLKASHQAQAGDTLVALSGLAPAMLMAIGMHIATRLPQRMVNTVTTNVAGPQQPLYAAGRRMLECFPYVPLAGHVRVGVAVFSYDGRLGFGVTGDWDTAADIGVLARGIEHALAELSHAVGGPAGSGRGRHTRPVGTT